MSDWSLPTTADNWANRTAGFKNRDVDLAKGFDPDKGITFTNPPTDSIRWRSASSKWELWNGSTWVDLASSYAISISGTAALATKWATGRTITLTGNVTGVSGSFDGSANLSFATTIAANAVANTMLRDSGALSVIGRSVNSTGDPADISAGVDDRLLGRTASALGFVQLTVGMIPNSIITYAKLQNVSATSRLLGRASAGAGPVEEIPFTSLTPFPTGTRMLFQQTSAPTGWTKETGATYNDSAMRVVTGTAATGGANAFTTLFGTGKSTAGYTLTTTDIPSHTHTGTTGNESADHYHTGTSDGRSVPHSHGIQIIGGTGFTVGIDTGAYRTDGGPVATLDTGTESADHTHSFATGGRSAAHTHSFTSASAGGGGAHSHTLNNMNLKFVDSIIGVKS